MMHADHIPLGLRPTFVLPVVDTAMGVSHDPVLWVYRDSTSPVPEIHSDVVLSGWRNNTGPFFDLQRSRVMGVYHRPDRGPVVLLRSVTTDYITPNTLQHAGWKITTEEDL
jgi:hypothetical protein